MTVTDTGNAEVWLVEDSEALAEIVGDYLESAGYRVSIFNEGSRIVAKVREHAPDLIVLDVMLPGQDGLSICRALRRFSSVPIVMLTARGEEMDRLSGYAIGADDYICKPVKPREILARVAAVLRRTYPLVGAEAARLALDEGALTARVDGRPVELTLVEFRLLELLSASEGRVFSREDIVESIYDDERDVSGRTVDSHVRNLRRKLKGGAREGDMIHSIYRKGYKFAW